MSAPKVGDRFEDMEWTGTAWTVVCPRCDRPMGDRDGRGRLKCGPCDVLAVNR